MSSACGVEREVDVECAGPRADTGEEVRRRTSRELLHHGPEVRGVGAQQGGWGAAGGPGPPPLGLRDPSPGAEGARA